MDVVADAEIIRFVKLGCAVFAALLFVLVLSHGHIFGWNVVQMLAAGGLGATAASVLP